MNNRTTLRRRLTALYAIPFMLTGVVLMAVPLLGASHTEPVHGQGGPLPGQNTPTGNHLLAVTAIGFALLVLASIAIGWTIAGRFLRPLRAIIDAARDISASNLDRRISLNGQRDEFAELAETLNDLFGRLDASFVAQRRFVANASHELRTPLTAQRTLLQVALADPAADSETLRSAGQEVLALGETQARLIDALLTLATGEQGIERTTRFDLAEVARRVIDARAGGPIGFGAQLSAAPVAGDERLAEILVTNLVDNAVKHNVEGGRVDVTTGESALTIVNTGAVVPHEELDRLFEPFQRLGTQRVRTGTDGYGLGLAIVRAIAQAHGAEVSATPLDEGGLSVTVTFPDRSRGGGP